MNGKKNHDTQYLQVNDQYYPDFLANALATRPDETNYCFQYAEKEGLTANQIVGTAEELIGLYQEILPLTFRSMSYKEIIESRPELEINEHDVGKSPPRWLDQIERRIGHLFGRTRFEDYRHEDIPDQLVANWSPEEVTYRKDFYTKASIIAALLIGDRQLQHYQFMLKKIETVGQ